MDDKIKREYLIYIDKLKTNSVRETWVKKNLTELYNYLEFKQGDSLSEKIYLLSNIKGKCKVCYSDVKFLSISRGYRNYCSKKCSNNDYELVSSKLKKFKETSLDKYGVDNPSKSNIIKEKIINTKSNTDYKSVSDKFKKTCIERYGYDNPSKLNEIKSKKENTNLLIYGVKNPFQSEDIKLKIKKTNLSKYGFEHPLKSDLVKNKLLKTNIERWGFDNYTKTEKYKEFIFEKYRSGLIKTNLNTNINYSKYLGLGKHEMICDCGECHSYITNSHLYHSRKKLNNKQCTICFPVNTTSSFKEMELYEFILSIYDGEIIKSYRDGLEIDIYLPELKIGFEFNGLYWHSELFKSKNYHLDKLNYFKNKNIKIINIWEDDWDIKNDIIKSQIRNWLSLNKCKLFARKCEVRAIDNINEYRDFLNNNHIQGYTSATIKIGLYYKNQLVSLMTFDHFEGRKKMTENEWNLSRFCNILNTNILGGASKLLNFFIKKFNPKRIISFADKSWSEGNIYYKLGFQLCSTSYPNYSYLINKSRVNKQSYKKSKLIKMGFDINKSESKIMEDEFGAYKIFDCGQLKFEILI